MEAYEAGEVKGQKPPSKGLRTYVHTNDIVFESSPSYAGSKKQRKVVEFKQHYLEPLQTLNATTQASLLREVIAGHLSIPELGVKAKQEKSMRTIKQMYLE